MLQWKLRTKPSLDFSNPHRLLFSWCTGPSELSFSTFKSSLPQNLLLARTCTCLHESVVKLSLYYTGKRLIYGSYAGYSCLIKSYLIELWWVLPMCHVLRWMLWGLQKYKFFTFFFFTFLTFISPQIYFLFCY